MITIKSKNFTVKELKISQISKILTSGDFSKLIGVRENEVFEAKSIRPYDLNSKEESEKIHAITELSSDVASFANHKGGFIIFGLDTPKDVSPYKDIPHDIVGNLQLFKKKDFYDENLIKGILRTSVYPKSLSHEVGVKWYPSSSNPDLGLGTIYVPPQDEERKYFIVRVCELGGKKFKGFLAIPIRKDDQPHWLSVQDVYKLSKRKPSKLQELGEALSEQLEGVENRLSQKINTLSSEPKPTTEELLELKIGKALNE